MLLPILTRYGWPYQVDHHFGGWTAMLFAYPTNHPVRDNPRFVQRRGGCPILACFMIKLIRPMNPPKALKSSEGKSGLGKVMVKRGGLSLVILLFVSLSALPGAYAVLLANGATCTGDAACQSGCCPSGTCVSLRRFYWDNDHDGRTGIRSTGTAQCRPPSPDWAARQDGDCNDDDNTIYPAVGVYPAAPELCDSKDNDCDNLVDEEEACIGADGWPCSANTQCVSDCCRNNLCGQLRRFYWDGDLDQKTGNTKSYSEQCVSYDNHWATRQDNDCKDDDGTVYP